jgi:hypothetical protein
MTIDLDERAERDDLAPTRRLHIIAEILAEGVRRRREDARRMGTVGDTSQHQEREESGLEPSGPVRLDRPPQTAVDALRTGESHDR